MWEPTTTNNKMQQKQKYIKRTELGVGVVGVGEGKPTHTMAK